MSIRSAALITSLTTVLSISSVTATHTASATVGPADPMISQSTAGNIAAYIAKHGDQYSGFWFDERDDRYVIAIPDGTDTSDAQRLLASTAHQQATGDVLFPAIIEHRDQPYDVLDKIFGSVTEVRNRLDPSGTNARSWYIDEVNNRVTIKVTEPESDFATTLKQQFGDKVNVVRSNGINKTSTGEAVVAEKPEFVKISDRTVAGPPQPPRLLDGTPYYTGNRIVAVYQTGSDIHIRWCTSAVANYPRTYIYTAGHCFPLNVQVYQGYYDAADNKVYYTGVLNTLSSVQWGNDRIDAASIRTDKYTTRQWFGAVDTIDYRPTSIRVDQNYVGKRICTNGSVSGQRCYGSITATDICVQYQDPDILSCGLTQATSTSGSPILGQEGDSGGPVIDAADFGYLYVMGIASGINEADRNLFYTPMLSACAQLTPNTCN
jgi:Trypsin